MAPPPAPESPALLLLAISNALSSPVAPSTLAAAYARPQHQKQSALPARQGFVRIRRARKRFPKMAHRTLETRQAQIPAHPQISPPVSNASELDPPAKASCPDPRAIKLIRASPTPKACQLLSLQASCSHPELAPLLRQRQALRRAV